MKYLFFITLFVVLPNVYAATIFNGKGHIDIYPIEMRLEVADNGDVTGHYLYTKTNIPITLQGSVVDDKLSVKTVNSPQIKETFKGLVLFYDGEISSLEGDWLGGSSNRPVSLGFRIDGNRNPLDDHKLTCEEMEKYPKLVFQSIDLGSGFGSSNEVDFTCPKSLSELDFLRTIIKQASRIRLPTNQGLHCTGSIIHAQWRYHHFDLANLGYFPEGFDSSQYMQEKTNMMDYFQEWSYQSVHNRDIYNSYVTALERAKPKLIDWYVSTHSVDRDIAVQYTDNALQHIAGYGFGVYPSYWKAEVLVPYTEEATTGNFTQFLSSIHNASEEQKRNSLKRLLIHQTPTHIIRKLVSAMKITPYSKRSETILSNAINNPSNLELLLQAGYQIDHQNEFGKTALYYAIQFNEHDSVKLLLEHGADVNQAYQQEADNEWSCIGIEQWGRTPLMHAAQHADTEMINILLDNGAQLTVKDILGSSAYDYAKNNNKKQNEQLLLKKMTQQSI